MSFPDRGLGAASTAGGPWRATSEAILGKLALRGQSCSRVARCTPPQEGRYAGGARVQRAAPTGGPAPRHLLTGRLGGRPPEDLPTAEPTPRPIGVRGHAVGRAGRGRRGGARLAGRAGRTPSPLKHRRATKVERSDRLLFCAGKLERLPRKIISRRAPSSSRLRRERAPPFAVSEGQLQRMRWGRARARAVQLPNPNPNH